MKTVHDYLNDSRITCDPEMMSALEPVKRIHAIRLKIQDEAKQMGEAAYNKRLEASLAQRGIAICYDRIGKGRIRSQYAGR